MSFRLPRKRGGEIPDLKFYVFQLYKYLPRRFRGSRNDSTLTVKTGVTHSFPPTCPATLRQNVTKNVIIIYAAFIMPGWIGARGSEIIRGTLPELPPSLSLFNCVHRQEGTDTQALPLSGLMTPNASMRRGQHSLGHLQKFKFPSFPRRRESISY